MALLLTACLCHTVAHSTRLASGSLPVAASGLSYWRTLDRVTAMSCALIGALLAQFFLVQLACLKLGKMNCHLAALVERDPWTALAAGHCKTWTSVIVYSMERLEQSALVLLALCSGLVAVSLGARHALLAAHCEGWDRLMSADLQPWRCWPGVAQTAGVAAILFVWCQSAASMWNVLTEQLRQEMGMEEPRWYELYHLYCQPDIRRSWRHRASAGACAARPRAAQHGHVPAAAHADHDRGGGGMGRSSAAGLAQHGSTAADGAAGRHWSTQAGEPAGGRAPAQTAAGTAQAAVTPSAPATGDCSHADDTKLSLYIHADALPCRQG